MTRSPQSNKNKKRSTLSEPRQVTRRRFLSRLWTGLGIVALLELMVVGYLYFKRRVASAKPLNGVSAVTCGPVNNFAPGSVTAFVRGRFYLTRLTDGGFLAISRQCTHLGCTVPWIEEEKRFACPCHASVFDITGEVINAPAPRALDLFVVSIENNIIFVETRQPIMRSEFRKEQAVYPQA